MKKLDISKLTVPTGVFNTSGKAGVLFKDYLKSALKFLNVGYTDSCCDETFVPEGQAQGGGVQSVTGDNVDNTDPLNPIIVAPYKVYTALLSQNGGDDIGYLQNGELTVGMTYKINFNSDGMDFTNVGAPNNEEGTYFVATGAEPFGWGGSIGTENILEYNLGAPIVTRIFDNTLEDTVYYTYLQEGFYSVYSDSFIQNKTFIIINGWGDDGASPKQISAIDLYEDEIPQIKIASTSNNDNWFKIYLEIRVYN